MLPAAVLSADKPWRTDLLAAALSVEQIAETHSGHDIYLYTPALVVDAIREIVDDVHESAC